MKKQSTLRTFEVQQSVLARDYRQGNRKWQPGEIVSKTGPLTYTVKVSSGLIWRRHVDQLLDSTTRHSNQVNTESGVSSTDNPEEFPSFTPATPPAVIDTPALVSKTLFI